MDRRRRLQGPRKPGKEKSWTLVSWFSWDTKSIPQAVLIESLNHTHSPFPTHRKQSPRNSLSLSASTVYTRLRLLA